MRVAYQEVAIFSLFCCLKHGHRLFFFSFVGLAMIEGHHSAERENKTHYWILHLLIHRPCSCIGGFLLIFLDLCLSYPFTRLQGLVQFPHIGISFDHIPPLFSPGPFASSLRMKRMLVLSKSKVCLYPSSGWLTMEPSNSLRESLTPVYHTCSGISSTPGLCNHISQYISKVCCIHSGMHYF